MLHFFFLMKASLIHEDACVALSESFHLGLKLGPTVGGGTVTNSSVGIGNTCGLWLTNSETIYSIQWD